MACLGHDGGVNGGGEAGEEAWRERRAGYLEGHGKPCPYHVEPFAAHLAGTSDDTSAW